MTKIGFLGRIFKNKEIALIIVLGSILRFYKLKERFIFGLEQPASLWPIVRLWESKKLTLIGLPFLNVKSGLFRSPFYIYIFALPLKIFKFDPLALEIIFALIGTITIFLLYLAAYKFFSRRTGIIASFLYSTSATIINIDKNIWVVTPIIITSTLILVFLAKNFEENAQKNLNFFLIGCLTGLGFSFHMQTIFILAALIFLFYKNNKFKKIIFFLSGVILLLSPVLIFNFKHDFIMLKNIKNLFLGEEVIKRSSFSLGGKLNNSLNAYSDLAFQILNFPFIKMRSLINFLIFFFLFLLPAFLVFRKSKFKKEKFFIKYFLLSCFFGIFGLTIIDQGYYSSFSFYLSCFIPPLLIIWARFLSSLAKRKKLIIMLLFFLTFSNLYSFLRQEPGNYQEKIFITNYVLNNAKGKKFNLKFINQDVLAYSYLFYYRAPFYNLTFNNFSLIEQWDEGNPDYFLVGGSYDWQEDKYIIKPFKKIADFNGVKVVIK